jgi:Tfp pilus assembly protein PilN
MPAMTKSAVQAPDSEEIDVLIEDAADLTPKELAQERKAQVEELKRRSWMTHTAEELAARIPVSIFAMGGVLATD